MFEFQKFVVLGILTCLVSSSSWLPISEGAKKPAGVARKEDIPYIKCQVCEKLASQLYHQVLSKQAEILPNKISEYQIIEISENICNLKKQEADWILKIDIVEQGDRLELVDQDAEGPCNSECKTIEHACQEVMGFSDTDVAEYIYTHKPNLDSLVNFLCKDLTKACRKKPPPIPKDRTPGEPFVPKSSKEAEMEKLLRSMQGMPGAPGMKMYSREDLMNQNIGDEDLDEDDDDEDDFPKNLGKALNKGKETKKLDWKENVIKRFQEASRTMKRHANTVSYRLRRWWKSKKEELQKRSKSSETEL
ncbi:unnamed protein product [Cuscuta europaea]|uniref:Saposin B-type domain-containing protein n=1 Tax=Cuscuta europaea TaxID=41803 RepID=A0A9P0YLD2_CUSEU|nr:unnamed protein product [Cuscuta europaea]